MTHIIIYFTFRDKTLIVEVVPSFAYYHDKTSIIPRAPWPQQHIIILNTPADIPADPAADIKDSSRILKVKRVTTDQRENWKLGSPQNG